MSEMQNPKSKINIVKAYSGPVLVFAIAFFSVAILMQELFGVTGFEEKRTQNFQRGRDQVNLKSAAPQKASKVNEETISVPSVVPALPVDNKKIINDCVDRKYFGSAASAALAKVQTSEELAKILFRSHNIQSMVNWRYLYFEAEGGEVLVLAEGNNQEVRLAREDENGLLADLDLKKHLRENKMENMLDKNAGDFHQLDFETVAKIFARRYRKVDHRVVQTFSNGSAELVTEEDSMGLVRIQGQLLGLKHYRCEI